jgi:hypothetical protein
MSDEILVIAHKKYGLKATCPPNRPARFWALRQYTKWLVLKWAVKDWARECLKHKMVLKPVFRARLTEKRFEEEGTHWVCASIYCRIALFPLGVGPRAFSTLPEYVGILEYGLGGPRQ